MSGGRGVTHNNQLCSQCSPVPWGDDGPQQQPRSRFQAQQTGTIMNNQIAAALLRAGGDADANEILFDRAGLSTPLTLPHKINDRQALKYYKNDLQKAVSISMDPRTSEAVLRRFVRDTRVGVRDALVANPSTPYDALVDLAPWVMARTCNVGSVHLVDRLNAVDLVNTMAMVDPRTRATLTGSYYGASWFPCEPAADKVAGSADNELILRAVALGYPAFISRIGSLMMRETSTVTLTEVVEACPQHLRGEAIVAIAATAPVLTVELAQWLTKVEFNKNTKSGPVVRKMMYPLVEDGAFELLASSGERQLVALATFSQMSNKCLGSAIRSASNEVLGELVDKHNNVKPGRYTPTQQIEILTRLVENGTLDYLDRNLLDEVLGVATVTFEWQLLKAALLQANLATTLLWIIGGYSANVPQPGQIIELVTIGGSAFTAETQRSSTLVETMEGRVQIVTPSLLGSPARTDALELLDKWIPKHLYRDEVAKLVKPSLDAAFGHQIEGWDTFLGLASNWDGGFAELLSAAISLGGVEPMECTVITENVPDRQCSTFDQESLSV